jgi:eukaryotic-like serine/threonine-protein kinase
VSLQVGQVLDKYELLERVGQGGMAIVYRGIDRSLKRVVAVKVLHKHLSDYQEARDRFEREAQAVAKLRHENILEIFDYSGAKAAEEAGSSYIVTEFIDGRTLKQIITDRPITFPEIGAMVVLQVCRALAHAHAAGILHRDVKPENIMIRSDGIVKLMDFGISHMLDLERLTVTGQLLGSPAYMAPEHVEGRQLDFRTDIFAVGIVLYQLAVGRLPFEGKNPHEVLKRIAECKFVDPRQANPQVGNRLGRIILRAMAAMPDGRYPNVGEMLTALEGYLEESGIAADKVNGELARYFESPGPYEQAFETRLVEHLTGVGQKLLGGDNRSAALDVFDRVLTIDPENEKVLGILDGLNRRRRLRGLLAGVGVAAVIGGSAYALERKLQPVPSGVSYELGESPQIVQHSEDRTQEVVPPIDQPAPVVDDAAPVITPGSGSVTAPVIDAPPTNPGVATTIRVFPRTNAVYQLTGETTWIPIENGQFTLPLTKPQELTIRNLSNCCQDMTDTVTPGAERTFTTPWLPARVVAHCKDSTASVSIDGRLAKLGAPVDIPLKPTGDRSKTVTVVFTSEHASTDPKIITVTANETQDVTCDAR